MDHQLCKGCQYFHQHYGLDGRGIFRLYCGHCSLSRPKSKKPDQKACPDFVQGENKENAFASKEYLSKSLLDWIRQLTLLPEIQEDDTL